MPLLVLWTLAGCQFLPGFDAVTIRPTYGWTDGCTDVKISGAGFDDPAISASVGGAPVTAIRTPNEADAPLDVGFLFYARTPPGSAGSADLSVINDGETSTVPDAFRYLECPGLNPEALSAAAAASGDTLVMSGCGLDPSAVSVRIDDGMGNEADASLTSECSTAEVSFAVPALPAGLYSVFLVDGGGDVVWPQPCDPTDSGLACATPFPLDVGGAP